MYHSFLFLRLNIILFLNILRYICSGKHFNSPTVSPTIEQINQSFGSTTPCTEIFDENKQRFVMNFRGLAFFFSAGKNRGYSVYILGLYV